METVLNIKNLDKFYKKRDGSTLNALSNINLELKAGERVALLGLNGAGKSSLTGVLSGSIKKTNGKIFIGGFDIDSYRIKATKTLGVVHQEVIFDSFFTTRESLEIHAGYYGIKDIKVRTDRIIGALGLEDKANTNTRALSGGMKRRLMVAKALIHDPKIAVLDEPTVGIDVEQRDNLWRYLEDLHKRTNIALIITTHYIKEAQEACDRVVVLDNGRIIEDGKMSDIIARLKFKKVRFQFAQELSKDLSLLIQSTLTRMGIEDIDIHHDFVSLTLSNDIERLNSLGRISLEVEKCGVSIVNTEISDASLEDAFKKIISS